MKARRIINFIELWSIVGSKGFDICVSSTSFQKSGLGWPQQPLTEKVLKFNMIFHDSSRKKIFSKHHNKAEFKNLDDSLTSVVIFLASAVSMTATASIHQNIY